jgi:tripartite ATP-independent transporter DctP family solute receptor
MKRLLATLVASVFVAAGGQALAQADFKASYKITMTQAATHPYGVGAQKFADLLKERTKGRITATVFTDSQLAKGEREMIEALQQGTIDIYVGSTGPVGNFSPSMGILDIPFLFRDADHVDKVLDGPIGQALLADLDKHELKGLAFWENGFRNLTNNRAPAKTPEEVKGLKLRTMENKVHMAAFKAAGLSPTPMAWAEVYSALQQKVIDAEENPVAVIYSSKIYEVQKYLTLTNHVYSPAPVIISMKKWQRIPKADQDIILATANEVAKFQRKLNRDEEAGKIKDMESKGFVVVKDVNKGAWQKAMQPAFDDFAKQFGKDKIDAILNTK